MKRIGGTEYRVDTFLTPLSTVAKETRHMDQSYITGGNDVTEAFVSYARPLIGGLPAIGAFDEVR